VSLAEVRARLEAEMQVRIERDRRITVLEAEVSEEREKRMNSAPASAMESLAAAVESERKLADDRLAAERDKWETRHKADLEELQRQRDLTREAEMEAAAIQDRIDELEGKSQEAKQESIEAKRLSGQRRAQIERMQAEVERARTSEHEKEVYWKNEMISLETKIRSHLEAAERKEPGADTRMVRVLEEVGVGVFEKYAKARKRLNKLEKDHEAAGVKIKTLQKVIDAHQKQGALLKKLEEQSATDAPKRTGRVRKKK
jgi:chromosome segregation ATPase